MVSCVGKSMTPELRLNNGTSFKAGPGEPRSRSQACCKANRLRFVTPLTRARVGSPLPLPCAVLLAPFLLRLGVVLILNPRPLQVLSLNPLQVPALAVALYAILGVIVALVLLLTNNASAATRLPLGNVPPLARLAGEVPLPTLSLGRRTFPRCRHALTYSNECEPCSGLPSADREPNGPPLDYGNGG